MGDTIRQVEGVCAALRQCALHVFPDCGPHVSALDVPPNLPPAESVAQARQMMQMQGRH